MVSAQSEVAWRRNGDNGDRTGLAATKLRCGGVKFDGASLHDVTDTSGGIKELSIRNSLTVGVTSLRCLQEPDRLLPGRSSAIELVGSDGSGVIANNMEEDVCSASTAASLTFDIAANLRAIERGDAVRCEPLAGEITADSNNGDLITGEAVGKSNGCGVATGVGEALKGRGGELV